MERLSFLQASFLSFEDELVLKKLHVPGFLLQALRVPLRVQGLEFNLSYHNYWIYGK